MGVSFKMIREKVAPGSSQSPSPLVQTYLLMYSPVSTFPQDLHLKQPKCHCLSSASSACPFLMSLPQPAQSGREQQPTVTAIPLANPKDGNSSNRGAARSHYVVKFCFGSLYKIPQDLSSRGKAAAQTLLDLIRWAFFTS